VTVLFTTEGRKAVESRGYGSYPGSFRRARYVGSVPLVGNLSYSYAKIYKTQPWVYAAVQKFARAVGQLPLKVYRGEGEAKERIREDGTSAGALVSLLREPYRRCTPTHFKRTWESSMKVYGNFFAVKRDPFAEASSLGLPTGLYPVGWWRVEPIEDPPGTLAYYVIRDDMGKPYPFMPEEVIHDGYWSPDSVVGISPLEPLRRTLAIEDATSRATLASYANGVRPFGALVSTQGRPFTADQAANIRAEMEETYGGVDKAFRLAVLGGGLSFEKMEMGFHEQELIPVRKLAREEVAAAMSIDPTQIGILDRATFSNVTEAHRGFYMDSVGPDLVGIEETLEAQLLRLEPEWADLDLEFDMNEVLKADVGARGTFYAQLIRLGFTPNEIRKLENLPPLAGAWANSGYVARELQPLDEELQGGGRMSVAELAVALQKIYLSVGKVITAQEAREILDREGAELGALPGDLPNVPSGLGGQPSAEEAAEEAVRALVGHWLQAGGTQG